MSASEIMLELLHQFRVVTSSDDDSPGDEVCIAAWHCDEPENCRLVVPVACGCFKVLISDLPPHGAESMADLLKGCHAFRKLSSHVNQRPWLPSLLKMDVAKALASRHLVLKVDLEPNEIIT